MKRAKRRLYVERLWADGCPAFHIPSHRVVTTAEAPNNLLIFPKDEKIRSHYGSSSSHGVCNDWGDACVDLLHDKRGTADVPGGREAGGDPFLNLEMGGNNVMGKQSHACFRIEID